MSKGKEKFQRNGGQTFLEYVLVVGVIISLLVAMTPMIRRAGEGMVKTVADHVGSQRNADNLGGRYGHLIQSDSYSKVDSDKDVRERLYTTTYIYNDEIVATTSAVLQNQGFTDEEYFPHGYTTDLGT